MTRTVIFALCVFLSLGCSRTLPAEVRADSALHSQFDLRGSLQVSVKNISTKWEECRPFDIVASEYIVIVDELGEARIEYRTKDNDIMLLVDLKKQSDKTHVAIYSFYKVFGWERAFRTLEHGAKNLPGCP